MLHLVLSSHIFILVPIAIIYEFDYRKQDEDSEEYGNPIVLASAIADLIKSRTEALLRETHTAVSSKPIVMRAEYAHCPNLTIIDTPGFVLKVVIILIQDTVLEQVSNIVRSFIVF